ncbi:MAG: hypothetical protein ACYCYO_15075 [Bacilli bacterium]
MPATVTVSLSRNKLKAKDYSPTMVSDAISANTHGALEEERCTAAVLVLAWLFEKSRNTASELANA